MKSNDKLKAAIPVVLFVLLASIVLGIIAILPYDRPAALPPNSYINLENGGFIASDGSMTFYVNGKGELRCDSGENNYFIASDVDTLCPFGIGIIYRTDDNRVVYADFDGKNKKTLADGAIDMAVNGNWLFYADKEGNLNKYFIKTGERSSLNLKVDDFLISRSSVLFSKDGKLYTARVDGSKVTSFFSEKVESFSRFESYIFYTADGVLYSVAAGNTANKQTYCEVDFYNISDDGILFYTKDNTLYSLDITDEKAKAKTLDTHGEVKGGICCKDDRVYFYSAEGKLTSCLADGSEMKTID